MRETEKFPTFNLHNTDMLKKLIRENPELPIVVIANEDANSGDYAYMFCSSVMAELGEILDCTQEQDDEACYTDRDMFRERIEENLSMSDEWDGKSDEEIEAEVDRIEAEYEPYWKKCIILTVGN